MDEENDVIESLIINSPECDAQYTGVGTIVALVVLVACVVGAAVSLIAR
jgi:hypothetical protein